MTDSIDSNIVPCQVTYPPSPHVREMVSIFFYMRTKNNNFYDKDDGNTWPMIFLCD